MSQLARLPKLEFEKPPTPAPNIGARGEFKWVAVESLRIDQAYQRDVAKRGKANVRRIVEGFDWSLFSPLVVSKRPNGLYAVIDGQHRATAAAIHGEIKELPCWVIPADQATEARAFAVINGQVTAILPGQLYYARLAAGDPNAAMVARICKIVGARILKHKSPSQDYQKGDTFGVSTIESAAKAFGEDATILAMRLVVDTGDGNPGYLRAPAIHGGAAALSENPNWLKRPNAVVAAVHRRSFSNLWESATKAKSGNSGPLKRFYADELVKLLTAEIGEGGYVKVKPVRSVPTPAPIRAAGEARAPVILTGQAKEIVDYLRKAHIDVDPLGNDRFRYGGSRISLDELIERANRQRMIEGLPKFKVAA